MRREKFVAHGGPDGGDGGRGGHVYLRANPELNTLLPFRYKQQFAATKGVQGGHRKQHGANGQDLYIDVPPGTQVRIIGTDPLEEALTTITEADLATPGQVVRVARGGKGGLGNVHFATSTHQAPRIAEKGEPGEERTLELELKIIADVGLIGYPNAGKSTLLSVVSAARPEIADYPFTTLEPVLGVAVVDDDTFVVADIPGLIEGASTGKGLGLEFLRHVERCRLLIHVLDGASGLFPGLSAADLADLPEDPDARHPLADFERINAELANYSPVLAEKPQIVAVNKMDLPEARERWPQIKAALAARDVPAYAIAAVTGEGVQELLRRVATTLHELPPAQPLVEMPPAEEDEDRPTHRYEDRSEGDSWTIKQLEPELYRVYGPRIERLANMTDLDNSESLDRLQRVLEKTGISQALIKAGVEAGHTVVIGLTELQWSDEPWVADAKARARRASRHTGPGKRHS
jgi:GTP-binding protein